MTLHKLTAGDGYTYLTRQVAAHDSTEKPHAGLGEYYSQRGEAPGRWDGAALVGLAGMAGGQQVTEEQMQALFGEGRHPDAAAIEQQVFTAGRSPKDPTGCDESAGLHRRGRPDRHGRSASIVP